MPRPYNENYNRGIPMKFSNKVLIPTIIILLAAAGGGWYLWQHRGAQKAGEGKKAAQGTVQYTCPMHPFIIKDKPGACPICGMTLVKKVAEAQTATAQTAEQKQQADMLGHVSLSPTQMVMANVATTEAKLMPLNKEINAVGIVQYDQARQAKVTAWVAGR